MAVVAVDSLSFRARVRSCALAAALLAALVSGTAGPAAPAAAADVSPTPAATVGATGKAVYDIVVLPSGRTILGGDFTALGGFARANLGAVLASGAADRAFTPRTDGPVHAIAASADGSTLFIGGRFTEVNGEPRHNLAAVDAKTGALVTDWRADTTGGVPTVTALAVHGDDLLVGGRFSGIDGSSKEKLAKLDATTGDLVAWNTWVNGAVLDMKIDPDGTTLWVGGEFKRIRGVDRPYFGAMDIETGEPTGYAPNGNSSRVLALAVSADGRWVYTTNNGNRTRGYKPEVSPDARWVRRADGNTQALAIWRNSLYLGGHFSRLTDTRTSRPFFAAVNRFDGKNKRWNPKARGANRGCWALVVDGNRLHAGGGFTHFKKRSQRLYARFDARS